MNLLTFCASLVSENLSRLHNQRRVFNSAIVLRLYLYQYLYTLIIYFNYEGIL